jgi:hypothetical protein
MTKESKLTLLETDKPVRTNWTYTRAEAADVLHVEVKKARLAAMVLLGLAGLDGISGDDIVDPIATIAHALYEIEYCANALGSGE